MKSVSFSSKVLALAIAALCAAPVGLGTGYHDGESAVGISVAHAFTRSLQVSGGVARVSGGKNVARLAVGFEF